MVRANTRRPGLGRVEALVLVLGMAVGVGLLLPACLRAQKASARRTCTRNLQMIVLAIHNYASSYGGTSLPSACSAPKGVPWEKGRGNTYPQSLFFSLLTFLEQNEPCKAGFAPSTNGNTWMGQVRAGRGKGPLCAHAFVKEFVCPEDPTNSAEKPTACGWVGCSYACNYQVFGTRGWAPKYDVANIPDGTSNTVFIAERFAQYPGEPGRFNDPDGKEKQANNLWAWPANFPPNPPTAYKKPLPQNAAIFAYGDPTGKGIGYGAAAFGVPQPGIAPEKADYRLAQSGHDRTIEVGMGDGSVHSVAAGVSAATWKAVLLPDDGRLPGKDW
jgi:hypothetical protein